MKIFKYDIRLNTIFKKGLKKVDDRYGVYFVTGRQGSGKTYYGVYLLLNQDKELVNKTEFQEYITSKIEDEAPSKGQTFGGIGLGIGYLFIFSTILAIVWAIFNPDLLNPEYDSTLESSIIQIIAGVITVVATGFIIGKGKVLKILNF